MYLRGIRLLLIWFLIRWLRGIRFLLILLLVFFAEHIIFPHIVLSISMKQVLTTAQHTIIQGENKRIIYSRCTQPSLVSPS